MEEKYFIEIIFGRLRSILDEVRISGRKIEFISRKGRRLEMYKECVYLYYEEKGMDMVVSEIRDAITKLDSLFKIAMEKGTNNFI